MTDKVGYQAEFNVENEQDYINLTFNIIFAPELTKTLICQLIFNDIDCLIHDTCSKKMICITKLNDG